MQKKAFFFLTCLGITGLLVGPLGPVGLSGCSTKKKDECQTNLDCTEEETSCVESSDGNVCKARGKFGDDCPKSGPPCRNKDTDGKKLVCDPNDNKCKYFCETNLDCDKKGQVCDTKTGICGEGGTPDSGNPPTETPPGKKVGEDCGTGIKCDSGLDCVALGTQTDGKCWATCKADADCKDGRLCAAGHCVPNADVCKGSPGGNLTQPCWAGLECLFESAGEGKCYRPCTADDCPNGLKCTDQNNKKYCLPAGDVAGPGQECGDVGGKQVSCTSGHQCIAERVGSTKKICTKECTADTDCTWPRFCQQICTLGTVGTAKIGTACDVKADTPEDKRCDGGLSCLVLQQGGGLCYRSCKDPRAEACPSGTTCVEAGQEKYCLKQCTKNEDCTAPTATCGSLQGTQGTHCLHGGP